MPEHVLGPLSLRQEIGPALFGDDPSLSQLLYRVLHTDIMHEEGLYPLGMRQPDSASTLPFDRFAKDFPFAVG